MEQGILLPLQASWHHSSGYVTHGPHDHMQYDKLFLFLSASSPNVCYEIKSGPENNHDRLKSKSYGHDKQKPSVETSSSQYYSQGRSASFGAGYHLGTYIHRCIDDCSYVRCGVFDTSSRVCSFVFKIRSSRLSAKVDFSLSRFCSIEVLTGTQPDAVFLI